MGYQVKQVIVARKDLNMRKGKLAAQVAHASLKVLLDWGFYEDNVGAPRIIIPDLTRPMELWLNGSFAKVVLQCADEAELLNLEKKCIEANIPCALITDAGKTEFKEPTITCLAIGPEYSDEIDKITGHLKLF